MKAASAIRLALLLLMATGLADRRVAYGRPTFAQPDIPVNTWVRIDPQPGGVYPGDGGDVRWAYDPVNDAFVIAGCDGLKNCDVGDGYSS